MNAVGFMLARARTEVDVPLGTSWNLGVSQNADRAVQQDWAWWRWNFRGHGPSIGLPPARERPAPDLRVA